MDQGAKNEESCAQIEKVNPYQLGFAQWSFDSAKPMVRETEEFRAFYELAQCTKFNANLNACYHRTH